MESQRSRAEVFGPTGYPVGAARLTVPTEVPVHGHDFCEIAVVVHGAARYQTRGHERRLGTGDVVAVRTGDWHSYLEPEAFAVVNLYLGVELLGSELGWLYDFPSLAGLVLNGGESAAPLAAAAVTRVEVLAGQAALPGGGSAAALRTRSLVGAALAELVPLELTSRPAAPNALVRSALAALEDEIARAWTVTDLAGLVACSPSHLQHRFADQLGTTPMGWLARTRAERMAVLLLTGDTPVSVLGSQVGWPDPSYAARRFRAVYGLAPRQYRARFGFAPPG